MELPYYYELHQFSGSMVYHLAVELTLFIALPEGQAYVNANMNTGVFSFSCAKA